MSDSTITNKADYGRHIPLRCKNHKNLRWATKNIDNIGARTIFFSGVLGKELSNDDLIVKKGHFGMVNKHECICDTKDLEVVEDEIKDDTAMPLSITTKEE